MKFLVLALVICAAAFVFADEEDDEAWNNFKLEHSKLFLSKGKESGRKKTFLKNRAQVQDLQAKADAGEISYTPKLYAHADLTTEEFLARFTGFRNVQTRTPVEYTKFANVRQGSPASFDSRNQNWVGAVKNQGSCGSCWTFSTMACLEIGLAVRGYAGYDLSEQQLVDCGKGGSDGCQGGFMVSAFQYLAKAGGAMQEFQYPYTGVFGSCRNPQVSGGIAVGAPVYPNPTSDDIKAAIMKYGTLAIACDASPWQFYGGGVFHSDKGSGANHAINVIGWGTDPDSGDDYWIVRNSWGPGFGEDGYIRLAASADGGYHLSNSWAVNLGF